MSPLIDSASRWIDAQTAERVLHNEWVDAWNYVGMGAAGAFIVFCFFVVIAGGCMAANS